MATFGANETGRRIAGLRDRLQEILRERSAAEQAFGAGEYREENALRERHAALERSLQDELRAEEERFAAARQDLLRRAERREAAADRALSAGESRLSGGLQQDLRILGERLQAAKERVNAEVRPKEDPELKAEIDSLRRSARELSAELERFAAGHGARLAPAKPEAAVPVPGAEPGLGRVAEDVRRIRRSALELSEAFWPEFARTASLGVIIGLDLLAHGGGAAAILHFALGVKWLAIAGGSLVVTLAAIIFAGVAARRRASAAVIGLHARAREALECLARIEVRKMDEDRIARIMVIDEQGGMQATERRSECEQGLAELRRRHKGLVERIARERTERQARLKEDHAAALERIREENCAQKERSQAEHVEARRRLKEERDAAVAALARRWSGELDAFIGFSRSATAECRERHPEWAGTAWASPKSPAAFPAEVPAGSVQVDLVSLAEDPENDKRFAPPREKAVSLPLALGFPACGSLLVAAPGAARTRALETLFDAVMRILVAFPPGKARMTIVDPVGLGQSFAALMHLADHDESLVGPRIWTDPAHIERRLGELTEHIEKVIQKYLRNRYATIDDYNREAGEMTEAYQFLVVADFPTGFTELALERLASIAASGPRCGVFTLIARDSGQGMPAGLDVARLRANGPALVASEDGGFVVDREDFRRGAFQPEAPPDGELTARLLKTIGERAREGQRVEVPFSAVAPADGQFWGASTETGLRVAIGRSGADRLQYLDLGRGTAQHALIGGRTGSGKSTLFHVIATNAAMWFPPGELELHLIDFKHGVEFKTYATAALPHARVIAVESDREFGLSVLNHINGELNRRGDLFRKHGVADLAGHRKSGAAERLPRILLVIDEFQEFFSEDDVIARDAALLLDRFVRQGRAFGLHVVLGSQTLSGMYTLAKSTLGQMGVRIALQCNEADSHAILSEDNSAARLLSRPGEAIYNDMSGLVEGNSPFQVVWLSDEVQEACLRQVAGKAASEGWRASAPPVVFEGNAPADLAANPELCELLGAPAGAAAAAKPAQAGRIWLGAANSIKGPTQVRLLPVGGMNLLMVGQHREAALGMICSAAVSLAAAAPPERRRLIVLGADARDAEGAEVLSRLAAALPGGVELPSAREIPKVLEGLEAEIAARREAGGQPGSLVCLMVFGLQRFPALRHEEDFGLSSGGEDGPSAGERFASILRDGPEQGVHSVVWCDTLNSANRALSRKTLREFDLRVLFQMSAADSSELIDSAAAGNLGLHNAILSSQSESSQEKFRPYSVPDAACIEELGRAIAARSAPAGST